MKMIKNAVLGLALASCAAFASATPYTSSTFVFADMNNPGTLQTYAFDSLNMYDDQMNLIVGKAGDTFQFEYLFNVPPPTAWFNFQVNSDAGGVQFTDAGLFELGDPMMPPANYKMSMTDAAVNGFAWTEGTVDLVLVGTYLKDGGSFSGTAAADIPEPMSLSLIGLGLAGMAGLRRRKASKAA